MSDKRFFMNVDKVLNNTNKLCVYLIALLQTKF